MSENRNFRYEELILNELRDLKAEVRDTRKELNQRMDRIENRHDRRSEIRDIVTSLFPILAITLPSMFLVFMLFLTKILK